MGIGSEALALFERLKAQSYTCQVLQKNAYALALEMSSAFSSAFIERTKLSVSSGFF